MLGILEKQSLKRAYATGSLVFLVSAFTVLVPTSSFNACALSCSGYARQEFYIGTVDYAVENYDVLLHDVRTYPYLQGSHAENGVIRLDNYVDTVNQYIRRNNKIGPYDTHERREATWAVGRYFSEVVSEGDLMMTGPPLVKILCGRHGFMGLFSGEGKPRRIRIEQNNRKRRFSSIDFAGYLVAVQDVPDSSCPDKVRETKECERFAEFRLQGKTIILEEGESYHTSNSPIDSITLVRSRATPGPWSGPYTISYSVRFNDRWSPDDASCDTQPRAQC